MTEEQKQKRADNMRRVRQEYKENLLKRALEYQKEKKERQEREIASGLDWLSLDNQVKRESE
jgi:hypothetical protein